MNAKQFEGVLANYTGYSAGEIDQRTRHLRALKNEFVSKRGRSSPHINSLQAVMMILCLVSRRSADASPVRARTSKLLLVRRPQREPNRGTERDYSDPQVEAETFTEFSDFLGWLLIVPEKVRELGLISIEISCDGDFARVNFENADPLFFTDTVRIHHSAAVIAPKLFKTMSTHSVRHSLVIDAFFLQYGASRFGGPPPSDDGDDED